MSRKGILLTNSFELDIRNGSLFVGNSTIQDQGLAVISMPGEWKESPAIGVGIENWLNDDSPADVTLAVKTHLKAIGMTVKTVMYNGAQLMIDADYE